MPGGMPHDWNRESRGLMELMENRGVDCPYCGERIDILIDCSVSHQDYIEDCQVCCRPIRFVVTVAADGAFQVFVADENDDNVLRHDSS